MNSSSPVAGTSAELNDSSRLNVAGSLNVAGAYSSRTATPGTRGESVIQDTLTLLDADGRTRWSGSTSDTSLTLPDSVVLVPGSTINWYVDGLQADGRSVGTGPQRLTVSWSIP